MQRLANHTHASQQMQKEWLSAQLPLAPFQRQDLSQQTEPTAPSSPRQIGVRRTNSSVQYFKQGIRNKTQQISLYVSPCLSFHDRLQRVLLYCWHSEPRTHHIQTHGRKHQQKSEGPGEWQALLTMCGSDKTKVPQSSCTSSVQEQKDYVSGRENKPYSLFLMLTNCSEVTPQKRKKCPVDKILDSTCPGKQLTIIYLHFIAHRISNSSFYASLCKTAAVIRYLYKSPSSTGEKHRAEPLASGRLTALRAGLKAGRGRDARGCPPSAGCFSLPFLTCSVSPSSQRGAVVLHWATLAAATWQQSGYDGNIGGTAPFLGQICPLAFGP